jgi:hypothetical protein
MEGGTRIMNEELKRLIEQQSLVVNLREIIAKQDLLIKEYQELAELLKDQLKAKDSPNG